MQAVYTIKLHSQRDDKAIEENVSLEIGQRMTHKAVITKNEGKIAQTFRSLSSGSITKIVRLMDVSNKRVCAWNSIAREGAKYLLELELIDDYYTWGKGAPEPDDDGDEANRKSFVDVVCEIGQAEWRSVGVHLEFDWRQLNALEQNKPFYSGKEKLRDLIERLISHLGYSGTRSRVITACIKAHVGGALENELRKRGLSREADAVAKKLGWST